MDVWRESHQNVGEAIGQGENNQQVLNPPQVEPHPQAVNQQLRALKDHDVPLVLCQ